MNTKKYLTIAICLGFAASFLTGCTNEPTKQASSTNSTSTLETTDIQPTTTESTSPQTTTPVQPTDTAKSFAQDAVRSADKSICEKIADGDLYNKCLNDINDNTLIEKAIAASDKTLCAQISSTENKAICETKIQASLDENNKAAADQKTADADTAKVDEFIKTGDISACKQLTLAGNQFECEVNILSQKASAANDKSICQQGSNDQVKRVCESTILQK